MRRIGFALLLMLFATAVDAQPAPVEPLTPDNVADFRPIAVVQRGDDPKSRQPYQSWLVSADGSTGVIWNNSQHTVWDFARAQPISVEFEGVPLAISPDGSILAWANGDMLTLGDLDAASELAQPPLYRLGQKAQFSPDGVTFIYGGSSNGGIVRAWHIPSEQVLYEFTTSSDTILLSADGAVMAMTSRQTVEFRAAADGLLISRLDGGKTYYSVVLNRDGTRALVSVYDPTSSSQSSLVLIDVTSGEPVSMIDALGYGLGTFSPDGKTFLAYKQDYALKADPVLLRDAETGGAIRWIGSIASGLTALTYLSDTVIQARRWYEGFYHVDLWDVANSRLVLSINTGGESQNGFGRIGDSGLLGVLYQDVLMVWGVTDTPPTLAMLPGSIASEVINVRAAPDGNAAISGTASGKVTVTAYRNGFVFLEEQQGWARAGYPYVEPPYGAPFDVLPTDAQPTGTATPTPTVVPTAQAALPPLSVEITPPAAVSSPFTPITAENIDDVRVLYVKRGQMHALSADGVTAIVDNQVIDTRTTEVLASLSGHPDFMAMSDDGSHVAMSWSGVVLEIYDTTNSGEIIRILDAGVATRLAFNANGTRLAAWTVRTESGKDLIRVWDTSDGALLHEIEYTVGTPRALVFSHDGTLLGASSAEDGFVLWDLTTDAVVSTSALTNDTVSFSPDWRLIAFGGGGTMRIWDSAARRDRFTFDTECRFAHFSPDLRRAVLTDCRLAELRDLTDGKLLEQFTTQSTAIFLPNSARYIYRNWSSAIESSAEDGSPLTEFNTDNSCLTVNPTSDVAASGDGLFDLTRRRTVELLLPRYGCIGGARFTSDSSTLVMGDDMHVVIYGIPDSQRPEWTGYAAEIVDGGVSLWSAPGDGQVLRPIQGSVTAIARTYSQWVKLSQPAGWVRASALKMTSSELNVLPLIIP